MKRIAVVFMTLLIFSLVSGTRAFSQEASDEVVISGSDAAKKSSLQKQPVETADATAKAAEKRTAETLKSALSVVQEIEGVVYLAAPSNNSYANGTKILFIRRRGPRLEPISQGQVIGEERNPKTKILTIRVQLDRDATVKYPQTGDRAVLLANEMTAPSADPKENIDVPEVVEPKKEPNLLPGYLEFGMGMVVLGSVDATPSSTIANVSKKSTGYRFKNTHFAYYSDFFPVGIEMDSHGGDFPTGTYTGGLVTSSEAINMTTFNYRLKPWGKFAPRLRVATLSENFKTNAVDGALLSTKTSGLGFGVRMDYEFASPIWKPAKNEFFMKLQSLQAEFTYFPSITATDQDVISRGTASDGSKGMYYGVQATALVWLDFVPWVKRWMIQAGYRTRSYDLKFSGPTVSEPGCVGCTILPNGTSKEKETDVRFFVGFRIDDPIRLIFPDKDKKKESK